MTLKVLNHAVAAAILLVSVPGTHASPAKPNVVMIFTDDMGYSDVSSFSDTDLLVTTPNIDRLATEGMKFTHFYVSMPICSPSRAALLSGRFAPETGLTNFLETRVNNAASDQDDYMEPRLSYLPKSFQAAGYATAHVGKWHLGGGRDVDNAPSIRNYGYDEAYASWESPNPDPGLGIANPPWSTTVEAGQIVRHRRTEYMVDKTLDFLQRHPNSPCFITLWPDDVHTPFWPSPAMIAKYGGDLSNDTLRQNFYGVLEEYDKQIGRLLDGLTTQGIANNTIVFFTGDNGPSPDYNRDRTNGMNGNKSSLYEGGIREPFLIRWPGHIPAGVTNSQTVLHSVDLLPTLCGLAGISVLPEGLANCDGENLSAAMLGSSVVRTKPLFWEYGRTSQVPRPGVSDVDRSPQLAIREGDYTLLLNPDSTEIELYNVRTDPGQYTNLSSSMSSMVAQMSAKVQAWYSTLPHRSQPYPVFGTVNFNQFVATEIMLPETLRVAAGAPSSAAVNGIAAAPNAADELFAVHLDGAGKSSFLRINLADTTVTKITDTARVEGDINASPAAGLSLVSGFEYSPPGDRLFIAENSVTAGQVGVISINVATTSAALVLRSAGLVGLNDHSVLADGSVVGVRGAGGNRSLGTLAPATAGWTQRITESQLKTASAAAQIIPEAIAVNNSGSEVHVFSHNEPDLFRIASVTAASPTITYLAPAALTGADLHDLVADQAGNVFGYDAAGSRIVVIQRSSGTVFQVLLSSLPAALGKLSPVAPTAWRGLAARMVDSTHADLFLASSSPNYGIIRLRFGNIPALVQDWQLY